MRNLFIMLILTVCSGCRPEPTVLKGHIENYKGEIVRVCAEGQAEHRDTLTVDSLGNFVFSPIQGKGGIYEISVKDHFPWIPVYIANGCSTIAQLALQPDKSVTVLFSGDRTEENEYLQAFKRLESGRMWYAPEMTALSFKAYEAVADKMNRELTAMLNRVTDPTVRKQFSGKQYLMFRLHLTSYQWRHSSGQEEKEADADYAAYMESIDLNDPQECNDAILGSVIDWQVSREKTDEHKDYTVAYLDVLDRRVSVAEIKNRHAAKQVTEQFRFFSGTSLDAGVERFNALCTDDSLRQQVNAEYAEYLRVYGNLMPGKPAPDFEIIDADGKKCRISDLRGKYLFIDIWATWCAPCRDEIPFMAQLQEHFTGDGRITLISISVDSNVKTWKKFLKKEQPGWPQYVADRKTNEFLEKEYRIYGIPHFMLIDPEGRFVSYAFTRPSDPDCIKLIEQNMNR